MCMQIQYKNNYAKYSAFIIKLIDFILFFFFFTFWEDDDVIQLQCRGELIPNKEFLQKLYFYLFFTYICIKI